MINEEYLKLIREIKEKELLGKNCDFEKMTIVLGSEPLIRIIILSTVNLTKNPILFEELMQEGRIGLIGAINSFNEGSTEFKTYASKCIKNKIFDYLRHKSTESKTQIDTSIIPDILDDIHTPSLEDTLIAKKQVELLKSKLTGHEIKLIEYYAQGLSYSEISEKLNITKKSVDNTLQKIKHKYKSILD